MKPTVALTFANCNNAHLHLLKSESSQLNQILSPLHDKGAIEVYREESTRIEDLANIFNRFNQRICIFHYAGHAGGEGLKLEEGNAYAKGLAALLQQQANKISLVFLNGCSTLGQVDQLMKLGIKAVIATSAPIEDAKAVEFSTWFYQALSVKRSLMEAFDFASACLITKYKDIPQSPRIEYRDFLVDLKEDGSYSSPALPWGLYVNEEHETILNWRMPDSPIQRFLADPLNNYKPNDYLPKILGAMLKHDPSLRGVIEEVKQGKKDKREVLPLIVQQLPWTIGAQLQKLISRSESMRMPGPERLKQSVYTYIVGSQMMLYILLSQLWEEQRKQPYAKLDEHLLDVLSLDEESARFFDYIAAFAQVGKVFQKNGWKPFVAEFDCLFEALEMKGHFYKAYLLLESVREKVTNDSLDAGSAMALCEEVEHALTIFIGTISFLIKYKMVAVRDISVTSLRYGKVEFLHKLGSLNAADKSYLTLDSDPKAFGNHAESGSVLLVDSLNEDQFDRYLSLSPFIIDSNAFRDKTQEALDIYLFSHSERKEYIYKNVNNQFQKMQQHGSYLISTGYEERIEVKDEVDFGWEFNESTVKVIRPYALLKQQFEHMKTELLIPQSKSA